jgi:hypothetical protein
MDTEYMQALFELQRSTSRELDAAQLGEPPSRGHLKAMARVIQLRVGRAVEEELRSEV